MTSRPSRSAPPPYGTLRRLTRRHGSPLYLLDAAELLRRYRLVAESFRRAYPQTVVAYSYKTNYLPALCRLLREAGAWAAVFSELEYRLARELGVPPAGIVCGGGLGAPAYRERAVADGALLNLDSFDDLDAVAATAARLGTRCRIGVRVNFALAGAAGPRPLEHGDPVSRFGFSVEDGDAERAVGLVRASPHLRCVGLHCHFSTVEKDAGLFDEVSRTMAELAGRLLWRGADDGEERLLNLGGNLPVLAASDGLGEDGRGGDYRQHAEFVAGNLRRALAGAGALPRLVLEPGAAIAEPAMSLITTVTGVKTVRGRRFVSVDGGVMDTGGVGREPAAVELVAAGGTAAAAPGGVDLVGFSASEEDVLCRGAMLGEPRPGDFVIVHDVGAYSLVNEPQFSRPRPGVVLADGGGFVLVRRPETYEDVMIRDLPPSAERVAVEDAAAGGAR